MTLASRKKSLSGRKTAGHTCFCFVFQDSLQQLLIWHTVESQSFFQYQSVGISFHNKGVFSSLSDFTKIVIHIVVTLVDCLSGFIYSLVKPVRKARMANTVSRDLQGI